MTKDQATKATKSASDAVELPTFSVYIPRCLLGERFIQASDEAEALQKYKDLAGITRTIHLPKVRRVESKSVAAEIAKIEVTV